LRVPDGRRGKVTCPRCGAEWFYPETIDVSEVEFRCAQSGARFVVQLSRRSPLHQFVIQAIKNSPPRQSNASNEAASALSSEAIENRRTAGQLLPRPKSRGWLANLFAKANVVNPGGASSGAVVEAKAGAAVSCQVVHDAAEYNWTSFFCPYCNASSFIRCSGGHFACDGPVEMRSGRRFHQCFCGNAGFIEGTIKTVEANQSSLSIEPEAATTPPAYSGIRKADEPLATALPSPTNASPLPPKIKR
jgi:hypothetical protein